jgi:hypothetical protein
MLEPGTRELLPAARRIPLRALRLRVLAESRPSLFVPRAWRTEPPVTEGVGAPFVAPAVEPPALAVELELLDFVPPVEGGVFAPEVVRVLVGGGVPAFGTLTVGLGVETVATGVDSVTLGTETVGVGTDTVGLGVDTVTMGVDNVTLGAETDTVGLGTATVRLGTETVALGTETVALGTETAAIGVETVAPGSDADAEGTEAVRPGSVTPEATAFEAKTPPVASTATPSVAIAAGTRRIR